MEIMFRAAASEMCVLLSRGGVNTALPCVFVTGSERVADACVLNEFPDMPPTLTDISVFMLLMPAWFGCTRLRPAPESTTVDCCSAVVVIMATSSMSASVR